MQRKKLLILAGAVLVLALLVSVLADMAGWGANRPHVVEIPNGSGTASIAKVLKQDGIIRHPLFFRLYAKGIDSPVWQKGKHTVTNAMSYGELCEKLQSRPDADEDTSRRVVIPEGYELRQILDLLVAEGLGDRAVFEHEVANGVFDYPFLADIPNREARLEGYLYPDTYLFTPEESEHQILNKMLDAFSKKAYPLYLEANSDRSLDEILILASVIEREAANDEERPTVASVFCNRIAIGQKLESCATVQYILKERKDVLSLADTAIDSPYNTYKYPGLPIGPIASPGEASIRAALYPADTDYLYFVAVADGSRNLFSRTFEEHNRKTAEIQNGD
ncbi:MAG: endolytic transglycosylase MltG [Clostridia bacterium]|nr:endolytic transglycosylase MltG [Clostridia bacterium]